MFGLLGKNEENDEFKKLEEKLRSVSDEPVLNIKNRENLKQNLMRSIKRNEDDVLLSSSILDLSDSLEKISAEIIIPSWTVFSMRERLLSVIEGRDQYNYDSDGFIGKRSFLRTAIGSVLLVMFVFTSIFIFPFQVPTTFAKETYLDEIKGDVYVLRVGSLIPAKAVSELQEGDVVLTKNNGTAVVHYFDDSVSRMSEDTKLEIKRLYSEPLNKVSTDVEVHLKEGRLWSKVVNLVDDSSFKVETESVAATVTKKAVFDVQVKENDTKVTVFDNVVNVKRSDSSDNKPATVVAGYEANVDSIDNISSAIKVQPIVKNDASTIAWVDSNLNSDNAYEKQLAQQKEKEIASNQNIESEQTPVTAAVESPVKQNEKAEDIKKRFLSVYNDFVKTENFLVRGLNRESEQGIFNFKNSSVQIASDLISLKNVDSFSADLLSGFINEKISSQVKDLSPFMPGDALYPAREAIADVQMTFALTNVDKVKTRLSQAESKLLDIQEMLKRNDIEHAKQLVYDYKFITDSFSLKITDQTVDEFKDNLLEIVNEQIQQVKVLTVIKQKLTEMSQVELKDSIEQIRKKYLTKIVSSLVKLPDSIPKSVVYDLKSLLESYMGANANDSEVIIPVLNTLLNRRDRIVPAKSAQEIIPKDLGVVVIEKVEATPMATPVK